MFFVGLNTWDATRQTRGNNQMSEITNPTAASEPTSPTAGGEGGQPTTQQPVKTFTQAEVDRLIAERLERADKKSAKEREEAAKKAAEESAAKNGEWQKLAEQRAAELADLGKRVAELEPVTAKLEAYEAAIKKQLEADRAKLPAHITALLDKLPLTEQIEWIAANRETVSATSAQPPTQPTQQRRIPGTPEPAGNNAITEAEIKRRQDEERRRARNSF